ncbi:unnamed protein product [Adineta steineri]|uniref:Uncharacterized protein n=1 Tax=Adineta steineri TaxID=433720 RepID=A0A814GR17_9BILA|nr:unnamed protein product [Adineta steineri]CAF1440331.1 unnamed protein product [Adineta steineri]
MKNSRKTTTIIEDTTLKNTITTISTILESAPPEDYDEEVSNDIAMLIDTTSHSTQTMTTTKVKPNTTTSQTTSTTTSTTTSYKTKTTALDLPLEEIIIEASPIVNQETATDTSEASSKQTTIEPDINLGLEISTTINLGQEITTSRIRTSRTRTNTTRTSRTTANTTRTRRTTTTTSIIAGQETATANSETSSKKRTAG